MVGQGQRVRSLIDRAVGGVRRAALVAFRFSPMSVRGFAIRLIAPTYTAGAAVVLRRYDGAILLVEQRHTGAWALPGGLMRRGETGAQAAAREVDEEVGISLDPDRLGSPRAVLDPRRRAVDLVWTVESHDGKGARRNDPIEVLGVGWFALDALPELTEPTVAMLAIATARSSSAD